MFDELLLENISESAFHSDVIEGLSRRRKTLPCRWLYDNRGSELFEEITRLPEYYPTRTETQILRDNIADIAAFAGTDVAVLEYGAGAGIKTELLLSALSYPRIYVPVDIAGDFLQQTVARMEARFPRIAIRPVVADFTQPFDMPSDVSRGRNVAFFPGSTIGNLEAADAHLFLKQMRRHVGASGAAIIGADLRKDLPTLLAAYDDAQGVTAAFNLNLLARINRELDGNFVLDRFRHEARWNEKESAVEMHIVSRVPQIVTIGYNRFAFEEGETIHTESSRKYDMESFASLARSAGFTVAKVWTDAQKRFALFGLTASA
jgi:dimethylhistidine N-methyltransferase